MKEKIFLDTDVILDLVFERKPFFFDSQKIFSFIEKNYFVGFTSSLIIANCYYIISSNKDKTTAAKTISKLRSILKILPFTDKEIGEALNSGFKDFEAGVQYFIAVNNGLNVIITRNISDYKNVDITVLMPNDFMNLEKIKMVIDQNRYKQASQI